ADALTLIAEEPRWRGSMVVTPHDREFARLAGEPPGPDRIGSALRLAAKMQATVLLKGDRTVVAAPDGTAWVNPTGTSALATAGGYGHGMVPVARAALDAGATWLGVCTLDEALALRAAGITAPVLAWLLVPGLPLHRGVEAGVDLSAATTGLLAELVVAART